MYFKNFFRLKKVNPGNLTEDLINRKYWVKFFGQKEYNNIKKLSSTQKRRALEMEVK